MGKMFSLSFAASAQTAQIDFFEVNSPSGCSIILHSIQVGQTTEAGDSAEEFLPWSIVRSHSTSGNGTGTTAAALDATNPATALATACETVATTQATGGSPVTLWRDAFNVRAGLLWKPIPEERITIPPSTRLIVGLLSAPADSITWTGTLVFEEV